MVMWRQRRPRHHGRGEGQTRRGRAGRTGLQRRRAWVVMRQGGWRRRSEAQIANSGLGSSVSCSRKGKEGRGGRTWWVSVAGERPSARRTPGVDPLPPPPDLPWPPRRNPMLAVERKELHREEVGRGCGHGHGEAVAGGGGPRWAPGTRERERQRGRPVEDESSGDEHVGLSVRRVDVQARGCACGWTNARPACIKSLPIKYRLKNN
jgi:hypothetical protein